MLVDKLVKQIQQFYPELPDGPWEIRRTYAGHHQRSNGAFSFFLSWTGNRKNVIAMEFSDAIGSQWPASYIVKHGIESVTSRYGDLHINPLHEI